MGRSSQDRDLKRFAVAIRLTRLSAAKMGYFAPSSLISLSPAMALLGCSVIYISQRILRRGNVCHARYVGTAENAHKPAADMRNLSDTLERLRAIRGMYWGMDIDGTSHPLSDLNEFGLNPGALRAKTYVPADLPPNAPLVVVLHGCTQAAAGYNRGSGWSDLAERYGFAVLFPEQQRLNNLNLCFNWYLEGDTRRDVGEALSIRQMVESVVTREGLDRKRIYIAGLSAGGAMVSAMLATYPDVFAGGAIIAGLAYGSATTIPEAFDRMRGHGGPSEGKLQASVRDASTHEGPWPIVSVWHGGNDRTVEASNMQTIVGQWRKVHQLQKKPTHIDIVDGYPQPRLAKQRGKRLY